MSYQFHIPDYLCGELLAIGLIDLYIAQVMPYFYLHYLRQTMQVKVHNLLMLFFWNFHVGSLCKPGLTLSFIPRQADWPEWNLYQEAEGGVPVQHHLDGERHNLENIHSIRLFPFIHSIPCHPFHEHL